MQSPFSPGSDRARWLRKWPLLILPIPLLVAAYLLVRPDPDPTPATRTGLAMGPRAKSGYENRAIWRSAEEPAAQAKAPKITGTIYDESGRALPGVTVNATTFQVAGNQPTTAGSVASDDRGRFELSLAAGSYYLTSQKAGYGSTLVIAHSGDEIGILLQRSGLITGHVYNERKEPVKSFSIDVLTPSNDDMAAPAPLASKHFESADGSFTMDQVPHHMVILRATAADHAPAFSSMVKTAPGSPQTVDFTMSAGCLVTGVVLDEEGAPLENVFIDAELRRSAGSIGDNSIDAASQAESDQAGRFRLEHVPVGDIMVRAYDGTHAVSTVETTIESCDNLAPVQLRMSSGGGLKGVVLGSDGKPVAGAKVTLSHRAIGFVNTTSDARGGYHFDKLPPGGMRIAAAHGKQNAMALVTINDGEIAEKEMHFTEGGTGIIQGRVTAGDTPLKGMQLLVVTSSTTGMMDTRYPVTAEDGTYQVNGLVDGMYAVVVSSTNQVASTRIQDGSLQNVDVDVSAKPKPVPTQLPAGGTEPAPGEGN